MANNTDCIDPIYETPLVPQPLPEDDCSCEGGGGGEGHKYTFVKTATGWQVKEDGKVIFTYTDVDTNTTYVWQSTTDGWLVKDNDGNVLFTYKDKDTDTTYSFEKKDDCGFKVTNSKGEVVFDYDNDCAGTTYSFEQDGVDIKVTDNKTGVLVFTYHGTVDTNTTYTFEDYNKGFKVIDSDGVVAYIYDPTLGDRSDGSYPIDTLLTTVFKGHTTISTGQIVGFTPADLVVGETLVYDGVGTVGVITKDNGDGTYEVTTMTISPGSRQGVRLGSVDGEDDLPATCADAEAKGWQTPQLGDFAYVTAGDPTDPDVISEYVITNIDDDCNITWTFSHKFNAGEYQEQSTTGMSGMILTGGPVAGTFGTPIDPTTLIRGVKRNGVLLTPDAQGKVNVIVDDNHIIVSALPTSGIVDKAEYVVIDPTTLKVKSTWVHDATGWYQTYEPPVNIKSHQIVTALPTTGIEENVEYIIVDADGKHSETWVYDPTLGWVQTEVKDSPAHIVVKDLPTTNIDDEAEYVQVSDLTDPVNTYVASWVHTDSGWIKVSEAVTATKAHIAVTALPTTGINENAEYLVMTNTSDPTTLTGTWVRVNGNWVQTEKMENGFHIVTSLPTSNIDDKNAYIVVEDLTKPDETLIGHYAYDKAHNKWISLSSKYEVYRGLSINGYATNEEDYQEMPVGAVAPFFGKTAPAHYLICDGTVYNVGTHPELEAFIIENYGNLNQFGGNGTTTWAVPDLRGEFLRGAGTNSHTQTTAGSTFTEGSGAGVGVHQTSTVHKLLVTDLTRNLVQFVEPTAASSWNSAFNADAQPLGKRYTSPATSAIPTAYNDGYQWGYTSRPTNTSVNWIIKADSTYSIVSSENKYAVSVKAVYTVHSNQMNYPVLSAPSGNANMVQSNQFVAPVDGYYAVNFMFPETAQHTNSYFGTYVYLNGTVIGGTRSQTGNGGITSTSWNDTYSMNSDITIQLKKGDKIRVGCWAQLNNTSTVYTETGRACFVLLQGAGADSNSRAEAMLKPNTWAVGVEQDFGDGVYGMRWKGKVSTTATGRVDLTLTPNASPKLIMNCGGVWYRTGGWAMTLNSQSSPQTGAATYTLPPAFSMIIASGKICLTFCDNGTHNDQDYEVWALYTK